MMHRWTIVGLALFSCLGAGVEASAGRPAPVEVSQDVPTGDAAKAAMDFWADWNSTPSAGKGSGPTYRSLPLAEGRVLLWYSSSKRKSKLKKNCTRTVKAFDALFADAGRAPGTPQRSAVLFELDGPQGFSALAKHLAAKLPNLAGWAQQAPAGTGFLLEEPLAAGWLETVPKVEVWKPENELVNRLARLLTAERFGHQPQWLAQGLAWYLELEVCKDVYCFPYRTGFVSKKEHKSWPRKLSTAMAARGERPVAISELTEWRRSTWNENSATLSWGAVKMLAEEYPEELPRVLIAFAELRETEGRDVAADGSWTWIAGYEASAETTRELLDRELGVDFAAELNRYLRKPKTYRRPR